jgi:hypothetical protein
MYGPPRDCKGKLTEREVCANVFGLFVESGSPGHDELRRVPFLINGTVVGDHLREQVGGTPL